MGGTNVNLIYDNWQNTGQTVQVDKWTADLSIQWTDEEGLSQEWEGVITFPNDLADIPAERIKEALLDLTIETARIKLGIS